MLEDTTIPLIPGEFVDIVRVDFTVGEVRYFLARQLDELIGVLPVEQFDDLLKPDNQLNIWIEEI